MNIHGFKDLEKDQQTYKDFFGQSKNANLGKNNTFPPNLEKNAESKKTNFNLFNSSNNQDGEGSNITKQNIEAAEKHRVLFLSGRQISKDPLNENYWNMLEYTCCPVCKCFSFMTICLIIYLALFITETAIGINKQGTLLQVDTEVAILMGANQPQRVRNGQIWRLITAAVLHVDFMHLLGNFVTTLIILSRVQYTIGPFKALALYVLAAIGGNILSALCYFDSVKLGASTCLYGAIGFCLGYLIINWQGLNIVGKLLKCQLICTTVFILIFAILFTSVSEAGTGANIDYFGHIGGFLTGLWATSIANTIQSTKRQKITRIIFATLLVIQFVVCFTLFFTTNQVKQVKQITIDSISKIL